MDRPSAVRTRLSLLTKGALKKTVIRFRGPDRPCRRPRFTCRLPRGVGLLSFDMSFAPSPPAARDKTNGCHQLRTGEGSTLRKAETGLHPAGVPPPERSADGGGRTDAA